MKGILRSRVALLALIVVALVCSAVLLTPKPVAAITCGPDTYPGRATTYYTDASRTKISCTESCGDTSCDPTPYYRSFSVCCGV
jgi:hypothetical protein